VSRDDVVRVGDEPDRELLEHLAHFGEGSIRGLGSIPEVEEAAEGAPRSLAPPAASRRLQDDHGRRRKVEAAPLPGGEVIAEVRRGQGVEIPHRFGHDGLLARRSGGDSGERADRLAAEDAPHDLRQHGFALAEDDRVDEREPFRELDAHRVDARRAPEDDRHVRPPLLDAPGERERRDLLVAGAREPDEAGFVAEHLLQARLEEGFEVIADLEERGRTGLVRRGQHLAEVRPGLAVTSETRGEEPVAEDRLRLLRARDRLVEDRPDPLRERKRQVVDPREDSLLGEHRLQQREGDARDQQRRERHVDERDRAVFSPGSGHGLDLLDPDRPGRVAQILPRTLDQGAEEVPDLLVLDDQVAPVVEAELVCGEAELRRGRSGGGRAARAENGLGADSRRPLELPLLQLLHRRLVLVKSGLGGVLQLSLAGSQLRFRDELDLGITGMDPGLRRLHLVRRLPGTEHRLGLALVRGLPHLGLR
jgi:hypothetical protein